MAYTRALKLLLLWGIIIISNTGLFAQTILRGIARNTAGKPLEGILIEVESLVQPPATVFAISGADGSYKLVVPLKPVSDSLRLSARALGYADRVLHLLNRSQEIPLELSESSTQLKEVIVRGAPITRSHDTLSYKVDAFTGKQDRVIADVLKKMPGIEVTSDGQISYEGRPISKFYINGQDLLEGRYSLASNNLPAEVVQSIQILENHQPIRALDSLSRPQNAALNLKLKNKVVATGQARIGAGAAPNGALYHVNVTPMFFAGRQQLLDTYQANNTGQDVAADLKTLTPADLQQLSEANNQKPELTGIQVLSPPAVATNRYLFNQVQLLNINHLVTIDKESQVRINAAYIHDDQTQRSSTRTIYNLPSQSPVTLTEDKYDQLYYNTLQTDLTFVKNVKRYYLKNTLSFDGRWDNQVGDVYRPEEQAHVLQVARNPFVAVTNRLGLVKPFSHSLLLEVKSLTFYTTSPQHLTVTPGVFAGLLTRGLPTDTTRQQIRLGSFFSNNSVGFTANRGHWAYAGVVGFALDARHLTSKLEAAPVLITSDAPLVNDLSWMRTRLYVQPSLGYKRETWQAGLDMPVSYYRFRAGDEAMATEQGLQVLTAEPRFVARHDIGALWYASINAGLRNTFGDILQLNYAYVLRDYRTTQRNDAVLPRGIGQSYGGGIYYKNPLKSRFFNANYTFLTALNNRLYSNSVNVNGSLVTMALNQQARNFSHSVESSVSQFISPLKINISLTLRGSLSQQLRVLNGTLAQAQSRLSTAILKVNCSTFEWGSLDYTSGLTVLRSTVEGSMTQPVTLLQTHHTSLSLFPLAGHTITTAIDYYVSQGQSTAVQAVFTDLTYLYTLPTVRKIDLEVRWSNVFNTRQYQYATVDDFILVQQTYQLRPAQLIALIRIGL